MNTSTTKQLNENGMLHKKEVTKSFTSELYKAISSLVDEYNQKNKTEFEIVDDLTYETSFSIIDNDKDDDNVVATFGW